MIESTIVSKQVEEIIKNLIVVFKQFNTIVAVILIGSCARGEETYLIGDDGEKELLSDVEFFIVVKNKQEIKCINREIQKLNADLRKTSKSPMFEISVGFIFARRMKTIDRRLIIFEAKECGKVIYGNKDILSLFPSIKKESINISNLVSIINQRLFHVIKEWDTLDDKGKKYCIARNTLDIPTVFLPVYGHLLASYKVRNKYLQKNYENISDFFYSHFIDRLNNYYEMKINFNSAMYEQYDVKWMREMFCKDMRELVAYLKTRNRKVFYYDIHRLIRAITHIKPKEIIFEVRRPILEKGLCDDMLCTIERGNWNQSDISMYLTRMDDLYFGR